MMRIAMLLHRSVEHDSRVRREARALLEAGHDVTVLHLPRKRGELDGELDGFAVRSVTPGPWAQRLPRALQRLASIASFVAALRAMKPNVIHAHDAAMLIPGRLGARATRAMLVYDSHELATGVPYRDQFWAWLVGAIERTIVPRCARVLTVSDGIADLLQARYGLRERPVVVRNFPDPRAYAQNGSGTDLRVELELPPGTPLALHLGAAALDRGCEALVRAVAAAPEDMRLLFLGSDPDYAEHLQGVAVAAGTADRVYFLPAVPVGEVLAHARQADVGVSLLEDTCENHRQALPNKVFEYLAAGVPVVASDLPELRRTLEAQVGATLVDPGDEAAIGRALQVAVEGERPTTPSAFQWSAEAERLVGCYAELEESLPGRALVLVRNGVTHDARVLREARLLKSMGFETAVAGVMTGATGGRRAELLDGVRVVRLDPGSGLRRTLGRVGSRLRPRASGGPPDALPAPLSSGAPRAGSPSRARLRRLATTADYYRRGVGLVRATRPALIHANDYNTAWIGIAGKLLAGSRLVYDSHELWPDRNLRPESRGWLLACETLFVRVADEVITTSPGYARVMARRYRIPAPRLVRNVPDWSAGQAPAREEGAAPLAVYFGAITRNRGLATALRALALVPELHMRFVGPEAWGYRAELARLAEDLGVSDRLELLDPVPPERAASVLADADLGLALIEPACLSYQMTLPNKLYEYVAAGLPVLSSDVPVLAAEVRRNGLGLVVDPRDPEAVAAAFREMIQPLGCESFRVSVNRLAAETGWGSEQAKLAQVYESL